MAVAMATSEVARAQDTWQKAYLDGEAAFLKHDYAVAEPRLRDAIARGPSVKNHGPKAPLISQQRGFIPEYYLAIICAETARPAEALKFAGVAETYLDSKTQMDTLKAAEDKASKAVAAAPPSPAPGGAGKSAAQPTGSTAVPPKPPADPFAEAATNIQSALAAGNVDRARQLRNQALAQGARGEAFETASRAVDKKDFDDAMAGARQALAAGHFSEARQTAERARSLSVDSARVNSFESEITRLQSAASASRGAPPPPQSAAPAAPPPPASPSPAVADAERRGLRALLSGDYQGAMTVLQPIALDAAAPRARFYLACAEAGLALTESDDATRANLESEAKRDWQAVAANRAAFAADLAYVSPAIARALGIVDR